MKAFFSSIIKPKEKSQPSPNSVAPLQSASTGTATATPPTPTSNTQNAASSASPVDAAKVTASPTTTAGSATPSSVSVAPSSNNPSTQPTVLTPDVLLTPPPASAITTTQNKKHAKALLDDYVGLIQSLFDHSGPLKKETEYFLEQFDEWAGRDAYGEIPKVAQAMKIVSTELPVTGEKGAFTLHEINTQIRDSISLSQSFLLAGAARDESRKNHSIPSLGRVKVIAAQCERDNAEAKKAQHEQYVKEFAAMCEKYGRNIDGTMKPNPPPATATTAEIIVGSTPAQSVNATPAATAPASATASEPATPPFGVNTASSTVDVTRTATSADAAPEPTPPAASVSSTPSPAAASVASPTSPAAKKSTTAPKKGAKK